MKCFINLLLVPFVLVACEKKAATSTSPDSIGVVAGEPVPLESKDDMVCFILGRLLDCYALEQGITASDLEIKDYLDRLKSMRNDQLIDWEKGRKSVEMRLSIDNLESRHKKDMQDALIALDQLIAESKERSNLPPETRLAAEKADRRQAELAIRAWKVNRSLLNKYGGKVTMQANGATPFDAYREFLRDQKRSGKFALNDETLDQDFWRDFEKRMGPSFRDTGSALALPELKLNSTSPPALP
jgi:hypothetical protein